MSDSRPISGPQLIEGLAQIAPHHDALICDVWGVIHDGARHHPEAAAALTRFRQERGPVVLLTNAPRVPDEVAAQCASFGLPPGCYDAIVSSGGAAREMLAARAAVGASAGAGATTQKTTLPLYYIGPERDLPMLQGLDVTRTGIEDAALVLAIGLVDDERETPADYADRLAAMRARGLVMLCANPDIQVHRGPLLLWCAGALARDYQALGGEVIYFGKPHLPVYRAALAAAAKAALAAGRPVPTRPLAVGDGLVTDIRGANAAGLDVLFIADGVHGEEVEPFTADHLAALFSRYAVTTTAVCRTLKW